LGHPVLSIRPVGDLLGLTRGNRPAFLDVARQRAHREEESDRCRNSDQPPENFTISPTTSSSPNRAAPPPEDPPLDRDRRFAIMAET
jgi:hypothetical protein